MNRPLEETLLGILLCPETQLPLRAVSDEELKTLNQEQQEGRLIMRNGEKLSSPLENAFLRVDEKIIYPFQDGIALLSPEHSILRIGSSE